MVSRPIVSVIIPAFNAQESLVQAVKSVQDQTLSAWEVIIINDASSDNTLKVAEELASKDKRIRIVSLSQNGGPSIARNKGIETAKGEWVAVLDADDAMLSDRLEVLLDFASKHNADIIADDLILYDESAAQVVGKAFGWGRELELTLDYLLDHDVPGQGSPLGWIKPMWKRAFLNRANLRYPVSYRHAEDFYFLAEVLVHGGKAWLCPNAGYRYTLRYGVISNKVSTLSRSKPDFVKIAESCISFAEKYSDKLNAPQKKKFTERRDRILIYMNFMNFKDFLRQLQILRAVKSVRSMALFNMIIWRLYKKAINLIT